MQVWQPMPGPACWSPSCGRHEGSSTFGSPVHPSRRCWSPDLQISPGWFVSLSHSFIPHTNHSQVIVETKGLASIGIPTNLGSGQ